MNNVLVLGNGFDLSLGLPTRYSDFVNSEYWPFKQSNDRLTNCLENFFLDFIKDNKDELDKVRWIDIEELLLSYAVKRREMTDNSDELTSHNREAYEKLCSAFERYLNEIACNRINKECKRNQYLFQLLTALKENNTYSQVYSFNYTPTKDILTKYFDYSPEVFHMHGSLKDSTHPLILGISDDCQIDGCYKFMRKSWHDTYEFHNLNDALFSAEECVFYGLSFGKADFIYFEDFFKSLIQNHRPGERKKFINIFTYDENSREKILEGFDTVGISMTKLQSVAQVCIHKISELKDYEAHPLSFDRYLDFLYHLSPDGQNGFVGIGNLLESEI